MNTLSERPLARDNPWYVLATIMGEPTGRAEEDKTLQVENRKVWNAWASQGLSDEEKREKSQKSGPDPFSEPDPFEGVEPWSEIRDHIEVEFDKRLPDKEIPDPSEMVDFGNLSFEAPVSFDLFFFKEQADFRGTTFTEDAIFRGASFTKDADFTGATFTETAYFGGARFIQAANFRNVTFTEYAHFEDATFTKNAFFRDATFTEDASFGTATFTENANFYGATFTEDAFFIRAAFEGRSHSQKAIFKGSVDFTDASFDKPCNLREATFAKEYPCLEGTNLHAKTTITADDSHWPRVESSKLWKRWAELTVFILSVLWIWLPYVIVFATVIGLLLTPFAKKIVLRLWPKKTITADDSHWPQKNTGEKYKEAMTSCAHLRHNMAAQGLPDHAHFFFRREMALKSQTVSGRERGWYWAYRISSNFGHSLGRPFVGLVFLWVLMAGVLYGAGVLCLVDIPAPSALNPLKLSFANMFPGFLFSAGEHFPYSLLAHAPWLEWLMWLQTILGSVLVFLFILGLRNRFRL